MEAVDDTQAGGPDEDGLDRARLEGWFAANVEAAEPPLAYERIAGGRSNLTFRVTDAGNGAWILRRPPLGSTLGSAHDMGREHRILTLSLIHISELSLIHI